MTFCSRTKMFVREKHSNVLFHATKRLILFLKEQITNNNKTTKRFYFIFFFTNNYNNYILTTMTSTTKTPSVAPLYFADSTAQASTNNDLSILPAELLNSCLVEYASWGDLAKLACVQKSFSTLLTDAGNESHDTKWELAQALLDGTDGLEVNQTRAMRLLHDLAGVTLVETDDGYYECQLVLSQAFAPAMKRFGNLFFGTRRYTRMSRQYRNGVGMVARGV